MEGEPESHCLSGRRGPEGGRGVVEAAVSQGGDCKSATNVELHRRRQTRHITCNTMAAGAGACRRPAGNIGVYALRRAFNTYLAHSSATWVETLRRLPLPPSAPTTVLRCAVPRVQSHMFGVGVWCSKPQTPPGSGLAAGRPAPKELAHLFSSVLGTHLLQTD